MASTSAHLQLSSGRNQSRICWHTTRRLALFFFPNPIFQANLCVTSRARMEIRRFCFAVPTRYKMPCSNPSTFWYFPTTPSYPTSSLSLPPERLTTFQFISPICLFSRFRFVLRQITRGLRWYFNLSSKLTFEKYSSELASSSNDSTWRAFAGIKYKDLKQASCDMEYIISVLPLLILKNLLSTPIHYRVQCGTVSIF